MRVVPYNREEHRCKNCYVWDEGQKMGGKAYGDCRLHPPHVQFVSLPRVDEHGNMRGMELKQMTGFPQMREDLSCYDHVPFPT